MMTFGRRALMQIACAAALAAGLTVELGCGGGGTGGTGGSGGGGGSPPAAPVVRKSASALSEEEIDRFERAFGYAVEKGFFDIFNDEHYDHERNRNHGADVLATSPMTAMSMPTEAGYRLLPWHRSFLLEAEKMLREALRKRDVEEGKDPSEADLLFIPYWDAAHEQSLPAWVLAFEPQGGTAIAPPGLPPGHAGYGTPVGERYTIVFGRWPKGNLVFDTLQAPDYVSRILKKNTFLDFYDAIDASPEVVIANVGKAQAALMKLQMLKPNDPAVQTLSSALSSPPMDAEAQIETVNALFSLGYDAAVEVRKPTPDAEIVDAVLDLYSVFNFIPHLRMHLWAGGLSPDDANIRGTVTYFNELAVDPVFWMLHAEIDRYWATWSQTHSDPPPLQGDDRLFQPLKPDEGAWYGGGKSYTLDELLDEEHLPYHYDALFAP